MSVLLFCYYCLALVVSSKDTFPFSKKRHIMPSLLLLFAVLAICSALLSGSGLSAHAFGVMSMSISMSGKKRSLVVISPPGGIGEVTAVKAATMGNAVKWFVVFGGGSDNDPKVVLSPSALEEISRAGGSVELAGADAPSLLGEDAAPSAIGAAVSQWCANASGLVCTLDGTERAVKGKIDDEQDPRKIWEDAIKVAAQEAGRCVVEGFKIAVLSADDDEQGDDDSNKAEPGGGVGGGLGNLLKSVVGKNSAPPVPLSLGSAMAGGNLVRLRHGDLFGIPESSVCKKT